MNLPDNKKKVVLKTWGFYTNVIRTLDQLAAMTNDWLSACEGRTGFLNYEYQYDDLHRIELYIIEEKTEADYEQDCLEKEAQEQERKERELFNQLKKKFGYC